MLHFEKYYRRLKWLPRPLWKGLEKLLFTSPRLRRELDDQCESLLTQLEPALKPYRRDFPAYSTIPTQGIARERILEELQRYAARETPRWSQGYASGAVYHGDPEHIAFLNRAYELHSQSNPLHADLWPSTIKLEAEIVAMTANMLGAASIAHDNPDERICGTVTSGGTESILLAMKAYRDWGREEKGIRRAEIVVPDSAHAAFEKAAWYFGMKLVKVPVGRDFRAQPEAMEDAITSRTVVMVGSAPSFPHGMIDPIASLAEIAQRHGIGFHTDACLGGFILPWAERLGYAVPPFDFRVPGVTSISVDTHKYGYAAKGTSVILYRGEGLRRYQYFATSDWCGGLYFSPTFAGSRPGGLSAACWAALLSIGEEGYMQATRRILETARLIRQGIEAVPQLRILGDPLWVIAFTSDELDIYRVMEVMAKKGWSLNGLHQPPAVHICVTLPHTLPGVAERFLADLSAAVQEVQAHPQERGEMAPVYGLAASLPLRGVVTELLKRYLDMLYRL